MAECTMECGRVRLLRPTLRHHRRASHNNQPPEGRRCPIQPCFWAGGPFKPGFGLSGPRGCPAPCGFCKGRVSSVSVAKSLPALVILSEDAVKHLASEWKDLVFAFLLCGPSPDGFAGGPFKPGFGLSGTAGCSLRFLETGGCVPK